MFLRFNRRFKDGKEHRYWNIVENKRCAGGKVVQRHRAMKALWSHAPKESADAEEPDCGASC